MNPQSNEPQNSTEESSVINPQDQAVPRNSWKSKLPSPLRKLSALRLTAIIGILLIASVGTYLTLSSRAASEAQYYVDKDSIGGTCSDTRTPSQVTISTPWCSVAAALTQLPVDTEAALNLRPASTAYPDILISAKIRTSPLVVQPNPGEEANTSLSNVSIVKKSSNVTISNFGAVKSVKIGEESAKTTDPDNVTNIIVRGNKQLPEGITIQDGASNIIIENNQISLDDLNQTVSRTGVFLSSGSCTTSSTGVQLCEQPISNTKISGNTITGGVVGINARKFNNLTIEKNDISGQRRALVGTTCVHTDSMRTFAGGENLYVRGNYIHDMDAQGFFIKDGPVNGLEFENNVISSAVILNRTCSDPTASSFREVNIYELSNAKLHNNTIAGQFRFSGGATGINMSNNIITNLEVVGTTFASRGNNLMNTISGVALAPGDITGVPTYETANMYHLATGSLGIDAGTSEGTPVADKESGSRVDILTVANTGSGAQPYYDIGAYEYGSTATPPPLTDTTAPTTSLTAPATGSTVSGTTSLAATATDTVGVTKVEFYQGTTKLSEDLSAPYASSWDTKTVANGSYSLTTKAYDAAGNVGTSPAVTVNVNNTVTDTTLPVVTITSPVNGATVNNSATISAKATDNVAVTFLQIYIDDVLYASTSSSSLTTAWNTKQYKKGAHTIAVKAKDAAGNVGTKSITVTVR